MYPGGVKKGECREYIQDLSLVACDPKVANSNDTSSRSSKLYWAETSQSGSRMNDRDRVMGQLVGNVTYHWVIKTLLVRDETAKLMSTSMKVVIWFEKELESKWQILKAVPCLLILSAFNPNNTHLLNPNDNWRLRFWAVASSKFWPTIEITSKNRQQAMYSNLWGHNKGGRSGLTSIKCDKS